MNYKHLSFTNKESKNISSHFWVVVNFREG